MPRSDEEKAERMEALLEAARRANWDALHGPPYLRSGRYRPQAPQEPEERKDG